MSVETTIPARRITTAGACLIAFAWSVSAAPIATANAGSQPGDTSIAPTGGLAEARRLLDAGHLDEARALLESAADRGAEAERSRLLGELEFRQQRWAQARDHLREALRLDAIADDHVRLGEVYIQERKFALALAHLRAAWRLGVMDGELHHRLAIAYAGLGRDFGDVQKVLAPSSRAGDRLENVLLIEELADEPGVFWAASSDSAAYQAARARSLGVDAFALRLLDARLWLAGRQYAQAVSRFTALEPEIAQADSSDAERAAIWADFAEACYRADDLEGYLRRWRLAHAGDRDELCAAMSRAHKRVADRYAARGDLAQCIAHLEKAVAETPRAVELRCLLGNRYWEGGEPMRAAREWRIVLQLDPGHAEKAQMLDRLLIVAAEYGTE